jgi:hypothetical protein
LAQLTFDERFDPIIKRQISPVARFGLGSRAESIGSRPKRAAAELLVSTLDELKATVEKNFSGKRFLD